MTAWIETRICLAQAINSKPFSILLFSFEMERLGLNPPITVFSSVLLFYKVHTGQQKKAKGDSGHISVYKYMYMLWNQDTDT